MSMDGMDACSYCGRLVPYHMLGAGNKCLHRTECNRRHRDRAAARRRKYNKKKAGL